MSLARPPAGIVFDEIIHQLVGVQSVPRPTAGCSTEADNDLYPKAIYYSLVQRPAGIEERGLFHVEVSFPRAANEDDVAGRDLTGIEAQTIEQVQHSGLQTVSSGRPSTPALIAIGGPVGRLRQ